jgi:hypothetical protein
MCLFGRLDAPESSTRPDMCFELPGAPELGHTEHGALTKVIVVTAMA